MKQKRVLVTGANGFIAQSLCRYLAESGFAVRGTVRLLDKRTPETAIEHVSTGPLETVRNWAPALDGVNAVVHTAATSDFRGPPTKAALDEMNRINVDASVRLADAAAAAGAKRFIYLSSIKVNGLTSGDRPFTADDAPRPVEPYGESKLAAECALRRIAAASNLELVILRPGLVYGPNPRGSVLQLMRIVDRGIPLPLASVDNRRSLLAAQNLCDLIKVCLDHPGAAGNTFLVSDGADISTPELIRRIARHMGRQARLFPMPLYFLRLLAAAVGKKAEVQALSMSQQLDPVRTCEHLGWHPPMQADTALRIAVEDYVRRSSSHSLD